MSDTAQLAPVSIANPRQLVTRLRAASAYGGVRVALTITALAVSVAVLLGLWPIDVVERSTRPGWTDPHEQWNTFRACLCAAGILVVWIVASLARAFLDRCDLALRAEQNDRT